MSTKITFAEWVESAEQAGRKKPEIARDLSITVTSLYRYLAKERTPSRKVMERIQRASGGAVDISCFFEAAA